jgi:hypothetical protein
VEPKAVVIGIVIGNDRKYWLKGLVATVRRDGAEPVDLEYADLSVGTIAGRTDPWIVQLPPGASYSMPVLTRYFSAVQRTRLGIFSQPAEVQLRLTTREMGPLNLDVPGLQFIRTWVGTLTSDWITVPRDCRR